MRPYMPTIIFKMKYKNPYQNKFQKGSPRLFGYDYAHEGFYFITICTKERVHYFGEVIDGKMILSDLGKIIYEEWRLTAEIRKDMMVSLDEFCIMPNHLHAIIVLGDPVLPSHDKRIPTSDFKVNQFGPQIKNLSSIIRGFKGSCTKRIHMNQDPTFAWQRRFYDHIIRDLTSLERIRIYIRNNPFNWKDDEFR
jgi:putative transposase